jgi:DNA-binding NtrC family response regulator
MLEAVQRTLRGQVDLQTACGGVEGLRVLREEGPFALVVSDMRMPDMNGAQFLAKAREHAPATVRMILSGQSDFLATLAAVNEGHIYRFLSKPCSSDQLLAAVQDGLNQHRLLAAESAAGADLEQVRLRNLVIGMTPGVLSARCSQNETGVPRNLLNHDTIDLTPRTPTLRQ